MKRWKLFAGIAAAAVLAVGVSSAAIAMYGGDDGPSKETRQDAAGPQNAPAEDSGDGLTAACLVGSADCNDTPGFIGDGQGGPVCEGEGCPDIIDLPADEPLKCEFENCAPAPAFEIGCAPDQPIEDCDIPAGYECVTMESFPPQVRCYPTDCVTILPAPADGQEIMPEPACEPQPPVAVDPALPPDCAISSDGVTTCADPCDPAAGIRRCGLPDDCLVDPEGGVSCPGSEGSGGGADPAEPGAIEGRPAPVDP